jgi:ABC-type lipoprotein release transport system permease subunit
MLGSGADQRRRGFALLRILRATVRLRAVSLLDGVAFATGLVMVVAAAAIAAYHPARRAARVDPALTLRADC